MAVHTPKTPDEVFLKALAKRPEGTESVLVLDPDRLIDWGRPTVTDGSGRTWHRLLYTGDDIALRLGHRRALQQGGPRLIVVTHGIEEDHEKIQLTFLADILAEVEGDPIDLSMVAYFKSLFSKVSPPCEDLRRYKATFVQSVSGLVRAYEQFKTKWGEPDSWTRGQLLAILLMARHDRLRLDELWCDQPQPMNFLLHAVRLMLHPDAESADSAMVRQVIRESANLTDIAFAEPWLKMDGIELAGYLVLRDALGHQGLAHPGTLLAGELAFSVDPNKLEEYSAAVVTRLREDGSMWAHINRLAERGLSRKQVAQVIELLDTRPEALGAMVQDSGTSPLVLRSILADQLQQAFTQPQFPDLCWVESLGATINRLRSNDSIAGQETAYLGECLTTISQVERQLRAPAAPKSL